MRPLVILKAIFVLFVAAMSANGQTPTTATDAPPTPVRDAQAVALVQQASGKGITYREWDINPKPSGPGGRGAERLVTGSDGSAYYTADHYQTFIRIR